MKEKTFEPTLPEGYSVAFRLNAQGFKIGLVLNLVAFILLVLVAVLAYLPVFMLKSAVWDEYFNLPSPLLLLIIILIYMVLHELTHGAAYKLLTKEKLTFGISWSCAFCGVPHIYTYRRTALISALAPLVVFSAILLPIIALSFLFAPGIYFTLVIVFGLHLGGASGDIYLSLLLGMKYRNPLTLINDTGPEMTVYVPETPADQVDSSD